MENIKNKGKIILLALVCFVTLANAQTHEAELAAADSSRFSVNGKEGWQVFNSYVAVKPSNSDSAEINLIVQHANNMDFKQEQLIGTIKYVPLQPKNTQVIFFKSMLDNNSLKIRIEPDGQCWLSVLGNNPLITNHLIIALKIFYGLE